MLKNPFSLYILSFSSVLCIYHFNWSKIYPKLSIETLAFFLVSFLISIVLAVLLSKTVFETKDYVPGKMSHWIFPLLLFLCIADIIYAGNIPLWMIVSGQNYDYTEFGIPTLHVVIMTFSQAFAVIRFADFLYSKKYSYLFQLLTIIGFYLLIVNRGAVLFTLVSITFVMIIKRGNIGFKRGVIGLAIAVLVMYIFGIIGQVRSGDVIEEIGKPTTEFTELGIPKPYFWGYIYASSPLANFQNTIDLQNDDENNFPSLVISEMLPDFISKRLLVVSGQELRSDIYRITEALTASGMFTRAYVYFGWIGVFLLFAYFTSVIVVYLMLIRASPYRVPALALLNTLVLFSIFDNMLAFTGMSLQLVWPLLFQLKIRN